MKRRKERKNISLSSRNLRHIDPIFDDSFTIPTELNVYISEEHCKQSTFATSTISLTSTSISNLSTNRSMTKNNKKKLSSKSDTKSLDKIHQRSKKVTFKEDFVEVIDVCCWKELFWFVDNQSSFKNKNKKSKDTMKCKCIIV